MSSNVIYDQRTTCKGSKYVILVNIHISQARKRGKKEWTKHEVIAIILCIPPVGELYHNKVKEVVAKYFPDWKINAYTYNELKDIEETV